MKKIKIMGLVIGVILLMPTEILAQDVSPAAEQTSAVTAPAISVEQLNQALGVIPIVDMRGNNYSFDAAKIFRFDQNPNGADPLFKMNEVDLEKEFQKMSAIFDVKGTDATLVINQKGELESLTKEVQAILFDRKKTKQDLIYKVKYQDYTPYELSFSFGEPPKKTEENMRAINSILGEYTTAFNVREEQRTGNIALGASFIDKKILMPGEEFSFLKTAGPLSRSKGYKNAKVIQDGDFVDGVAGGACQVSTTLFNAVLKSGLSITSRRNHSLPISYVPRGMDAAVANQLDFKFKNNLPHPIYIQSYVDKGNITMRIYGNVQDYRDVKLTVQNTAERKYTLIRDINGQKDYFHSSYGIRKKK